MQKRPKHTALVLRYYLQHVRKYPRYALGSLLVMPLTVSINVYLPSLILADVLSKLGQHHYTNNLWSSFGPELVAYGLLLLLGIAGWRLVDFFTWRLEMNISRDIAEDVFKHLLSRSADFHANHFTGSLVSQTNKLIGGYIRIADTTIYNTYPLVAGIVIAAGILSTRSPLFAVALLVFSALYLLVATRASRPVRRVSGNHAKAESEQTGVLADAVTNALAIKSFAGTSHEQKRFAKATSHTQASLREFARLHQMQMNVLGLTSRSISIAALFIAVIAVMKFNANIGTVFLIFSFTSSTVEGLFNFGNNGLRNYSRAVGDANDMVTILNETPEILDPKQPEQVRISKGAIAFDHVTFTHNGAKEPVFADLNLHIKPGEKIGLVGHSGSGKSTLSRLLLRFSDIQKGEVLIDGQNIAHITQDDLHRHITYVPQEPLLFHRTILENIAYGNQGVTQAEIELAAQHAHAAEFIANLPSGYDTLVGERGVKLSGGQRQRIAIARAMLKEAPILLLDEATSALDSESEVLIQDALWKLMERKTAIVIAHRLSTIQKMDRIIVLDDGKIVEQGTHAELLEHKGSYAKLWAHQSGGFIEE